MTTHYKALTATWSGNSCWSPASPAVILISDPVSAVKTPYPPGLWSRSRRLGLERVSRRTNVSSRSPLEKNCQRLGLVSVSANYVSCPRPIIG